MSEPGTWFFSPIINPLNHATGTPAPPQERQATPRVRVPAASTWSYSFQRQTLIKSGRGALPRRCLPQRGLGGEGLQEALRIDGHRTHFAHYDAGRQVGQMDSLKAA